MIHILDVVSGKSIGTLVHNVDIAEVAVDQMGPLLSRHVAVVDKDRNLLLAPIRRTAPKYEKIGNMTHSIAFHDTTNILAALFDGKISIWYHPR
jgi:intraflagellar transport protein 80